MRKLYLTALCLMALTLPAFAGDLALPAKAAPYTYVTGFNWSGIYIGGEAGYGFSAKQLDTTGGNSTLSTITDPGSLGPNAAGGIGGLTLAMRYQPGSTPWVFGIKTAFDVTGINSSSTPDFGTTLVALGTTGITAPSSSVSIPWNGRLGGEIGYAVIPNLLLFGDAGLAFGEIKMHATAVDTGAPTINQALIQSSTDNIHTGWWAGLGLKYAVLPNLIIGAEWVYTDLGTKGISLQGQGFTSASSFNVTDKAAFNAVMATVEIKFP
jgi:outer membrane immunogenic protein